MKNDFTLFILLFWTSIFVGQTITERTIQGRISVESNFIDGVKEFDNVYRGTKEMTALS